MNKVKRFYYRLMASGYSIKKNKESKEVKWQVPHYSKMKYVVAPDEATARQLMREKLTGVKWTGFRLVRVKQ